MPKPTVKEAIEAKRNISSGGADIAGMVGHTAPKKSAGWMAAAKALAVATDAAAQALALATDAAATARAAVDAAEAARAAATHAAFAVDTARNALAAVELEERRHNSTTREAEKHEPLVSTAGGSVETYCNAVASSSEGAEAVESILEGKEVAKVTGEVEAPATSAAPEMSPAEPVARLWQPIAQWTVSAK